MIETAFKINRKKLSNYCSLSAYLELTISEETSSDALSEFEDTESDEILISILISMFIISSFLDLDQ